MDDITQLANLIKKRNSLASEITALIGRPAQIGHIGEYIASRVFNITLEESSSSKSIDGRFREEPLKGRTVNIKWYALLEGLLDITPNAIPDFYLVLTGPKSSLMTSRGQVRPWFVDNVFLFDAAALVDGLKLGGVKFSVATSVRQHMWAEAEIYPTQHNNLLELSEEQRRILALFGSAAG
jgi:hypothetical protein